MFPEPQQKSSPRYPKTHPPLTITQIATNKNNKGWEYQPPIVQFLIEIDHSCDERKLN